MTEEPQKTCGSPTSIVMNEQYMILIPLCKDLEINNLLLL